MPLLLLAAVLGLVEGLTEFLPISSTGHLILADHLLGFDELVGKDVAHAFEVVIQLGAIAAVVVAFPQRFAALADLRRPAGFAGLRGLWLLAVTTLPAVVAGLAGAKAIKAYLFSPLTVAVGLIVGSIWIAFVEFRGQRVRKEGLDSLTPGDALAVGLFQCLALWPGMSRSAATILGGVMLGIDRKTATEYSFFAAVPVLVAASGYELYKNHAALTPQHAPLFAVGLIVSFISALVAVKFLMHYLARHTLLAFAWYRLALGFLVLVLLRHGQ